MPSVIIGSPDAGGFHLDRQRFEEAAIEKFGNQATIVEVRDEQSPVDVTAQIDRSGEPWFQIRHFRDGGGVSTDGTPDQAIEVMLWVRSVIPHESGKRVWAFDSMYNGHVELVPGMSEDDIKAGWVDHADSPSE
jgi:hypothetical protein